MTSLNLSGDQFATTENKECVVEDQIDTSFKYCSKPWFHIYIPEHVPEIKEFVLLEAQRDSFQSRLNNSEGAYETDETGRWFRPCDS